MKINSEYVTSHNEDPLITTITINRPSAFNSLTPKMVLEIGNAISNAQISGSRAIILTGSGKAFCAGADVNYLERHYRDNQADSFQEFMNDFISTLNIGVIRKIAESPIPVLASVNGIAAGAGVGLALACDVRIIAEDAGFVLAYSNLGITPDAGVTYYLPRVVGLFKAIELYHFNTRIDSSNAFDLGLVSKVTSAEDLPGAARSIAMKFANGPTKAFHEARRLFDGSFRNSLGKQLQLESEVFVQLTQTDDFSEGLRAFSSKEPPKFSGS